MSNLENVKARKWFYKFDLPDGSTTECYLPDEIEHIHRSRRTKLRQIIEENVSESRLLTALDLASHEGYYSFELGQYFRTVTGIEVRESSIELARLMARTLGIDNVRFQQGDLQKMDFEPTIEADFVLVYGLIYHVENPVHTLRLASQLCRQHILIESQVFPYDVAGRIEDGSYRGQRDVKGVFALSPDYSERPEGGSTDFALIPSLNALLYLLRSFGFKEVRVLDPIADDYEQFVRGSRVVVYGKK